MVFAVRHMPSATLPSNKQFCPVSTVAAYHRQVSGPLLGFFDDHVGYVWPVDPCFRQEKSAMTLAYLAWAIAYSRIRFSSSSKNAIASPP